MFLRNPAPDFQKHKSIHSVISELICDLDVQKVSVDSTLNKRYLRDDDASLVESYKDSEPGNNKQREIDGDKSRGTDDSKERETAHSEEGRLLDGKVNQPNRNKKQKEVGQKIGKAFIICNQYEDPDYGEHCKEALKDANTVLKDYFDFAVSFYTKCFAKIIAYQKLVIQTAATILYNVNRFF